MQYTVKLALSDKKPVKILEDGSMDIESTDVILLKMDDVTKVNNVLSSLLIKAQTFHLMVEVRTLEIYLQPTKGNISELYK